MGYCYIVSVQKIHMCDEQLVLTKHHKSFQSAVDHARQVKADAGKDYMCHIYRTMKRNDWTE